MIDIQKQETFDRVVLVINIILDVMQEKDKTKRPIIHMNSDLYEDLGIDSLETLDLLNGLEEEFGVNPDQYEAVSKHKIFEIVDYIIELKERQKRKVDKSKV